MAQESRWSAVPGLKTSEGIRFWGEMARFLEDTLSGWGHHGNRHRGEPPPYEP
jgi:hypothetical protein